MVVEVPLPAQTHIRHVHLRVKDLSRVVAFYEHDLGFRVAKSDGSTVALSATGQPPAQVILTGDPAAVPRPPRFPGLFHVAFRYPNRTALAAALRRLVQRGYPIHGASDHAVSEAIYLADPEGNGIELYCDRPKESWQWRAGEVHMVTEPLDLDRLFAETDTPASAMHPQADVGHVHLSVSSLAEAEQFYAKMLGFEITTRSYPGALFLAAGSYHHHVGANVWFTRKGMLAPENAMGLIEFGIGVPLGVWKNLEERLTRLGLAVEVPREGVMKIHDFDNIGVEIAAT